MMKNLYLFSWLCLLFTAISFGQELQNNNWIFGENNSLRFYPTETVSTAAVVGFVGYEGCASVSDRLGNLLLFSDGERLWYNPGNGSAFQLLTANLLGNPSSAQNVIFVPVPKAPGDGSSTNYYVVTINGITYGTGGGPEATPERGLYYSEIEISNGTASFIGTMNIPLKLNSSITIDAGYHNVSEGITSIVEANSENYWVITHVQHLNGLGAVEGNLLSYEVTPDGVGGTAHTPTVNTPLSLTNGTTAATGGALTIKISRDATNIAISHGNGGIELGSFNNSTGTATGLTNYNYMNYSYGLEFSSDSNWLYYVSDSLIHRLNISNPSDVTTEDCDQCWGLELAVDHKIYISALNETTNYYVLDNPNIVSTDPIDVDSVSFQNNSKKGFPQWVWKHQCEATLFDNDDIPPGYDPVWEQRSETIFLTNTIESNPLLIPTQAIYHAGNFVELLPNANSSTDTGFEAQYGSQFVAYIKSCDTIAPYNDFNYRHSGNRGDSSKLSEGKNYNKIKIYPNPSSKTITVSYDGANLKTIRILSMDGKVMASQNVDANLQEIDISSYA
ncbi:MAG TPA: T9SS type A sorting domain-containing protein, partial [Pedobacter sp.]|uniref:3-coathanger stack domain-containing protein n=1 Tax=Pedobacter sp. TaxID=1411316 RepID=UPI002CF5B446